MTARRATFLAVLVAFAAGLAAQPAAAPAATYSVWSCRDLAGNPLPTTAWRPGGHAVGALADTCPTGGALSAWLTNTATFETAVSGYRFAVPPGLTITQYFVWFSARTDALAPGGYQAGVGQFGELSPAVVDHGCNVAASTPCVFGDDLDPLSPLNYVGDTPSWPQLSFMAICPEGSGGCTPNTATPARIDLYRSEVRFDDSAFPTVDPTIGGTIASGGSVAGTRSVRGEVADVGAGVRRVELLVDGAVVAQQAGTGRCTEPYVVAAPCPDARQPSFDLDTTTLADGPHDVALRAIDAAGNATTGPVTGFVVDNAPPAPGVIVVPGPVVEVPVVPPPAPPTPTPPPVEEPEPPLRPLVRLTLPDRIALPADEAGGRLTGPDGTPKSGVVVSFERRPIGGGDDDWRPMAGRRTTGADGRFAVPVPDASAEIRAVIGGAEVAGTSVVRFVRDLDVAAEASRDELRNGDEVVVKGRFRHAGGALEERPVLVQAQVRDRWRTVDSIEADEDGRVRWEYRFENTTRTARYTFRLVLPRTKGLPWSRMVSDEVRVLVRPDRASR